MLFKFSCTICEENEQESNIYDLLCCVPCIRQCGSCSMTNYPSLRINRGLVKEDGARCCAAVTHMVEVRWTAARLHRAGDEDGSHWQLWLRHATTASTSFT